jgi:phosphomevalonate kinase
MRVAAPGKLLLTGSYAVLEGAPALVCAVDRLAIAGVDRLTIAGEKGNPSASPEVVAAMEGAEPPAVDVSQLFSGTTKLGLGSSAAAVVAALGLSMAERNEDLRDAQVRKTIFDRARAAHARVQSGGSGVDIAASTYGGVLRYQLSAGGASAPSIVSVNLPAGVVVEVYWSGQSVRTSDMRARVDALKLRDRALHGARMSALSSASEAAVSAIDGADAAGLVEAARATEAGLAALGRDADAPIVPPSFRKLMPLAEAENSAFLPSGAGGGDVFVRLGLQPASARFTIDARAFGLTRLELRIDTVGVRVVSRVGDTSS